MAKTLAKFEGNKKLCRKCKVYKPYTSEFFHVQRSRDTGLHSTCRECVNSGSKKYRERLRATVFKAYSNGDPKCICCGEQRFELLCLDHIDGGGTKEINNSGGAIPLFFKLKKAGYPKGYQVLCHNCNNSKADLGLCVHVRESSFAFLCCPSRKKKKMGPKSGKGRVDNAGLYKRCAECDKVYPADLDHFSKNKRGLYGLFHYCKGCYSKYRHEYVKEVRYRALLHFSDGSPACASCGISELEFLCIDHISGGGRAHRKEMGNGYQISSVNGFLKIMKDPDKSKYQVLCWNCNYFKHHYGS